MSDRDLIEPRGLVLEFRYYRESDSHNACCLPVHATKENLQAWAAAQHLGNASYGLRVMLAALDEAQVRVLAALEKFDHEVGAE